MENPKPKSKGAWLAVKISAWSLWAFLLVCWPLNMFVVLMQKAGVELGRPSFADPFHFALLITAIVTIALTFLFRWLFFRFLINENRFQRGHKGATVWGIIGVIIIYALTKSVEIYGLVIALLSSTNFSEYLIFWAVSFITMLIHLPNFLIKGKVE